MSIKTRPASTALKEKHVAGKSGKTFKGKVVPLKGATARSPSAKGTKKMQIKKKSTGNAPLLPAASGSTPPMGGTDAHNVKGFAAYHGSRIMGRSAAVVKGTGKTAMLAALYQAADGDENTGQETRTLQEAVSPLLYQNNEAFREIRQKTFSTAREQLETTILKERLHDPVKARTAFSPSKIRRREFVSQYRQARGNRTFQNFSKASKHIAKRAGSSANKLSTVKTVAKKALNIAKPLSAVVKSIVHAFGSILKSAALIVLPILLLLMLVLIISVGDGEDDTILSPMTGNGTVTEDRITLSIYQEYDLLLQFQVPCSENLFHYEDADSQTMFSGEIEENAITLTGTLQGIPAALQGKVEPDGLCILYGFWGDSALQALSGTWQNPFGDKKYTITSEFGNRFHPIDNVWRYHSGYDLCSETGENTPVYAVSAGKVSFAGVYGGYGNAVIIDHGEGLESLYGHLNRIKVEAGDEVHTLQQIGTEGNTGQSTGPHLHFEVRKDGEAVDGAIYLSTLYTNALDIQT